MKCALCPHTEELETMDYPAIRLCPDCKDKLFTHIATICEGCDAIWWVRKSPRNVMDAAIIHKVDPTHIMKNAVIFCIPKCQNCYEGVREFMVEAQWIQ